MGRARRKGWEQEKRREWRWEWVLWKMSTSAQNKLLFYRVGQRLEGALTLRGAPLELCRRWAVLVLPGEDTLYLSDVIRAPSGTAYQKQV